MTYEPEDPRLTAYALGEMDEDDRDDIEAWLEKNEAARKYVEEVRLTAAALSSELKNERSARLTDAQHGALAVAAATRGSKKPPLKFQKTAEGFSIKKIVFAASIAAAAAMVVAALMLPSFTESSKPNELAAVRYADSTRKTESRSAPATAGEVVALNAQKSNVPLDESLETVHLGVGGATAPTPAEYAIRIHPTGEVKALEKRPPAGNNLALGDHFETVSAGNKRKEAEWNFAKAVQPNEPFARSGQNETLRRGLQRGEVEREKLDKSVDRLKRLNEGRETFEFGYITPDNPDTVAPKNAEAFNEVVDNPFLQIVGAQNALSTFSIDVDTASYSNVRRYLNDGQLPPKDAVRIEEMINYFKYDYAAATASSDDPFSAHTETTTCPWNTEHRLVRIGLKGREVAQNKRPPTNLVFLIDVSGSMNSANKLPLVQRSLKMLVDRLDENDRVALVVYAGSSGLVLPSTSCNQRTDIYNAIDRLSAGGSTNGGQGIQLAYDTAVAHFIKDGVNRVVLATDGDWNVGITNQGDLVRLIEDKAKTGVFLSVLGFGTGNYKDGMMEKLADKGNGNYAYIDTIEESRKVLVEQMAGTLVCIAKDVKIQVEFNPAKVAAYRLIGYENRVMAHEDFNNDKKDAGDIGAGHTVTAMYEIVPAGKKVDLPSVDPLKYQIASSTTQAADSEELMTLKLRYKQPDGQTSKKLEFPVTDSGASYAKATKDFKFAAAVASFGMLLRESEHKGNATFDSVLELAAECVGGDNYRSEFIQLVNKAKTLKK